MSDREQGRGVRVLVIDDHPAVRQGVGQLLAAGGHFMAAEAENGAEARSMLLRGGLDLALLDLTLAEDNAFELLVGLREHGVPVVVYSMHEDSGNIERALLAGALGYVTKRDKPKMLWAAIAEAMAGRRFLSPRAAQSLEEASRPQAVEPASQDPPLSDREREILVLLSRGNTRLEIADALSISGRTVETYYKRLIAKLNLADMKALRKYAIALLHAS